MPVPPCCRVLKQCVNLRYRLIGKAAINAALEAILEMGGIICSQ